MEQYDNLGEDYQHFTICYIYDASLKFKLNSGNNEGTFLVMNDIKSKKRNKINNVTLNHLVFLIQSGWTSFGNVLWKKVICKFLELMKIK